MKKHFFPLLLICFSLAPGPVAAGIEWQAGPIMKTATAPVDVAISADGNRIFVLADGGKLHVFDQTVKTVETIDIDPTMDNITSDGNGNRVIVSSRKNSLAQPIDISYRFPFDYTDSPFLGKAEAPVVLALFSDFQ